MYSVNYLKSTAIPGPTRTVSSTCPTTPPPPQPSALSHSLNNSSLLPVASAAYLQHPQHPLQSQSHHQIHLHSHHHNHHARFAGPLLSHHNTIDPDIHSTTNPTLMDTSSHSALTPSSTSTSSTSSSASSSSSANNDCSPGTGHSRGGVAAAAAAAAAVATTSAYHGLLAAAARRQRGEKRPIPVEQKDDKYFERRKRNNEAAKKSRDARKMREDRVRETLIYSRHLGETGTDLSFGCGVIYIYISLSDCLPGSRAGAGECDFANANRGIARRSRHAAAGDLCAIDTIDWQQRQQQQRDHHLKMPLI